MREQVVNLIAEQLGLEAARVDALLEVPPDERLGDYALPCFVFAQERKQAPPAIAAAFAEQLQDALFTANATGPYVNLHLDRRRVAETAVRAARTEKYGRVDGQGERVMVEFSQPNTHKAFHAGHLRGTSMGEALARILAFAGRTVVRANYSGDTGMHVAKWLWCYTRFHDGELPPAEGRGAWLASIYVEAVRRLAESPELEEEVQALNLALDKGEDKRLMRLWEETRQWSIDELEAIYDELDTRFDVWTFEREVEPRAKEVARELLAQGVAEESDGATIVDLEEEGLGVWVLLRQDGTPLYSAKDLALAEKKFTEQQIDRAVYVVGKDQELHFRQLFATLRRWGFAQAERCVHLCFEMVRLPGGKMSSRTGQNLLYADVRDEVFAYTEGQIRERHPDWTSERVAETVRAVGVCALKFEMIVRDINRQIVFETERICDFEGDTGPYVQYTHARCNSILKRLGREPSSDAADFSGVGESEYRLAKELLRFPVVVAEAADTLQPAPLARYALSLAKACNTFYHECKVVGAGEGIEDARALLVDATRLVLARALSLLGIAAPSEM